jgi:hypothetical protein
MVNIKDASDIRPYFPIFFYIRYPVRYLAGCPVKLKITILNHTGNMYVKVFL